MSSGTTKISERMTWKQLQQCTREKNDDFSQLLAQNFLLLHQQAREKKDPISLQTLEVITSGFVDLTKAVEDRKAAKEATPDFTNGAWQHNKPVDISLQQGGTTGVKSKK